MFIVGPRGLHTRISLACGPSRRAPAFLNRRAARPGVQGIGAALMNPANAFSIITTATFPAEGRRGQG